MATTTNDQSRRRSHLCASYQTSDGRRVFFELSLRVMPGLMAAVCGVGVASLAVDAVDAQVVPGWNLNWVDNFSGPAVDGLRWEVLTRRDSFNNEKQYYLPAQVSIHLGNLRLTATNEPLDGKAYRSGLVRTWAEQTYGRWEVRASLPTTQGMWPAIWLLPRNANWPSGGEIDIMENRGSEPFTVGSAYHFGATVAQHEYVDRSFGYSINNTPVRFHGNMHTYAVEWDPQRIRFFVNGIPHYTLYGTQVPISSTPMSLILNLAVGGNYGGDPNATTQFPQNFDIDYVRVYSRDASNPKLRNASFEESSGRFFGDWVAYGGGGNVVPEERPELARTGVGAAKIFGRFDGSALNNSGLFQELPAAAGETWQVDAHSLNRPGDALLGGNVARIKLEFLNNSGSVIAAHSMDVANASTPTAYRLHAVRRIAPAGTAFARAVLEMVQVNSAAGAVTFDDAQLSRVTAALPGDLNRDGVLNVPDVDLLLHSLKSVNTLFDFDGSGVIDSADGDAYLSTYFSTVRGDSNLDGRVDFVDLLALARNYGQSGTGWASGDFTGEGWTDFADLLLVARNYVEPAAFEGDWQLALASAPEPSVLALMGSTGLLLMRRGARMRGPRHAS